MAIQRAAPLTVPMKQIVELVRPAKDPKILEARRQSEKIAAATLAYFSRLASKDCSYETPYFIISKKSIDGEYLWKVFPSLHRHAISIGTEVVPRIINHELVHYFRHRNGVFSPEEYASGDRKVIVSEEACAQFASFASTSSTSKDPVMHMYNDLQTNNFGMADRIIDFISLSKFSRLAARGVSSVTPELFIEECGAAVEDASRALMAELGKKNWETRINYAIGRALGAIVYLANGRDRESTMRDMLTMKDDKLIRRAQRFASSGEPIAQIDELTIELHKRLTGS